MSGTAPERLERLDLDDVSARVERQQAEARKVVAEQGKPHAQQQTLAGEQRKLAAEREKMPVETMRIGRDRFLAALIAIASVIAAVTGCVSILRR